MKLQDNQKFNKSNEKFNESRKGGLSGAHQSKRPAAAAAANGRQRRRCHICRDCRASSASACLCLCLFVATVKQVERNDALHCFFQPLVCTLQQFFPHPHTHRHTHIHTGTGLMPTLVQEHTSHILRKKNKYLHIKQTNPYCLKIVCSKCQRIWAHSCMHQYH